MLKSDQQEKVPTTTPARSTAETILRRIPNNVNKEQQIHLRNLMDLNKQWSISDTTKLREKPNHKSLPSYTSKIWQSSTSPHVHLGPHQRHQTLPQQQTADSIEHTSEDQNKTWTKHRCSSLDPITHPIRNRRLRQILTARILRRRKSRRRNGKP